MPSTPCAADDNDWYVIRTHPRQELRSLNNLRTGGIEAFCPLLRVREQNANRERGSALFPQYLFARFECPARMRDVMFTRGVQTVVQVGEEYGRVSHAIIDFLKSCADPNGYIEVRPRLERGDIVRVDHGAFESIIGIVQRVIPAQHRVVVLLAALHSNIQASFPQSAVSKV